jgi:large subunit ribosomal protein L29
MKSKEIKSLSPDDRKKKLKDLRDDLMRERGVAAMGGAPISPGKIRAVRTNIARILTIENQLRKEEKRKTAKESRKALQAVKQIEGEKIK